MTSINVNDICRTVEVYGVIASKAFFLFHSILPQIDDNEMRGLIENLIKLSSQINDTVMMFIAKYCSDYTRE